MPVNARPRVPFALRTTSDARYSPGDIHLCKSTACWVRRRPNLDVSTICYLHREILFQLKPPLELNSRRCFCWFRKTILSQDVGRWFFGRLTDSTSPVRHFKSAPWAVQHLVRGSSPSPHTLLSLLSHLRATSSIHIHGGNYSERIHEHNLDSLGPRVLCLRPLGLLHPLRATLLLNARDIPTSTFSPQLYSRSLVCRDI